MADSGIGLFPEIGTLHNRMTKSEREARERSMMFSHHDRETVRKMFIQRTHEKEFAYVGEPVTRPFNDDHIQIWNGYEAVVNSPYYQV